MGTKISVKIKCKQGCACKKYRNNAGVKTQEDYPTTENRGKERLEEYSISVA